MSKVLETTKIEEPAALSEEQLLLARNVALECLRHFKRARDFVQDTLARIEGVANPGTHFAAEMVQLVAASTVLLDKYPNYLPATHHVACPESYIRAIKPVPQPGPEEPFCVWDDTFPTAHHAALEAGIFISLSVADSGAADLSDVRRFVTTVDLHLKGVTLPHNLLAMEHMIEREHAAALAEVRARDAAAKQKARRRGRPSKAGDHDTEIFQMLKTGQKPKDIAAALRLDYDTVVVPAYERYRNEERRKKRKEASQKVTVAADKPT
jgi:hypothetical protein